MNPVLKEEIIYIKSQIVYLIAFTALFCFAVSSNEFTTRKYFYYINYLTVFISSILITLYIIQVAIGWIFEERNFYQRSLIYSFILTLILAISIYLNREDDSVFLMIFMSILYFIIIEAPRLAIIFALDSDKLDFKFLTAISKHINKVILLYLLLIITIVVLNFKDATFNMFIFLAASGVIVILVSMFYAWRLNSNKTLNKMKKIGLLVGGFLFNVIVIKYSFALI
jgi:hypothetical protein